MSGRSIAIQCNVVQSSVLQCDRVEIGIVRVQSSESLVVVHVCNPPSRQLRASDTDLGLVRHRHEGIKITSKLPVEACTYELGLQTL